MSSSCSRRRFLCCVAGALSAPVALYGCRRKSAPLPSTELRPRVLLEEPVEAPVLRPPLPAREPTIRVRVVRMRTPGGTLHIGSPGQWLRVQRGDSADRGMALAGPLRVSMEPAGWSIVDGHGFRAAVDGRAAVEIAVADDEKNRLLTLHEPPTETNLTAAQAPPRQYPGLLRLIARQDLDDPAPGGFDVINDLPLETYLPGVLAGELYRTWHLQTFAAQAVAARSFACTEIAVFAGRRHFDVTNTAASQVYVGNVRDNKPHEATSMTRGMVLAYENLLVSGYYSSCCGGVAATASDVIGSNPINDVAPLRGRSQPDVCSGAPVYQWKIEYPLDLLSRRLIAYGNERRIRELMGFTRLQSVEIVARNAHGRPTRVRIMDDRQNSVEMTAENFRRAVNHSGQGLAPPPNPLRSSNVTVTVLPDKAIFEGLGFGHGAGLCQWGAETLAKSGKSWREIVQWYYPGASIAQAYG